VAYAVQDFCEVWYGEKAEGAFAELASGEDFGFEEWCGIGWGCEAEAFAGDYFPAGADEGGPDVFVGVLGDELLGEEDFDAAGGVG
jgi:hypothetical protein